MRILTITLGLIAAWAILSPASGNAVPPSIRVDEPFPHLVLPAITDGHPLSVADARGRKVVLHIFGSW